MTFRAIYMYPPFLSLPHARSYILEINVLLLVYVIVIVRATRTESAMHKMEMATSLGLVAALIEICHISIENFGHLDAKGESVTTGIFMCVLFLTFAVSGYCTANSKLNILWGFLGASWSAVVCMLLVTTFGVSQLFWSFSAIEIHDIGDPDFIRTGWTDMHAFVIADIFEASSKVLFIGPIAGLFFGLIGASIARIVMSNKAWR